MPAEARETEQTQLKKKNYVKHLSSSYLSTYPNLFIPPAEYQIVCQTPIETEFLLQTRIPFKVVFLLYHKLWQTFIINSNTKNLDFQSGAGMSK